MALMIYRRHICNVLLHARANRTHSPTSPNIAPAGKNHSHDLSSSHMQRPFACEGQQDSPSNITKYCACQEKWLSWFIAVTYETSFCMRGAAGVAVQHHQILSKTCGNRTENGWNVIYIAAPIPAWSEHDLLILGPPFCRAYFSRFGDAFCMENTTFCAPAIYPNFTQCCACHEKRRSNTTKCATNAAPATKNDSHAWSWYDTWDVSDVWWQMWVMWLMSFDWTVTERWLGWNVTLLNCYLTELFLDLTVTWLMLFDWTVIWLNCYLTELLFHWFLCIFKFP